MAEDSKQERCSTCGGTVTKAAAHGSITQWMFICNCHPGGFVDVSSLPEQEVCSVCGKNKKTNRSGTLTQWIFKPDLCACDDDLSFIDNSIRQSFNSIEAQGQSGSIDLVQDIDEPSIEVPSGVLPQDRYKVVAIIGRGGTGTVYKARDLLLNKLVAVKSLHLYSPEQVVSFQREAKALSKLDHPNIVKVIDFGITDEHKPYMVMQLFEGSSLESYIKNLGSIPFLSAVELFIVICAAVSHAHDNDVFHRDLKPSNILISVSEQKVKKVLVIDFGVATISSVENTQGSQGSTIVGTPIYMSPDQAEAKKYDARSEIYSIGVMLFEALTGEVPFLGNTGLETISLHAHQKPPTLKETKPEYDYPAKIETIVAKCLEKSPDRRYQNLEELKSALINSTSDNEDFEGAESSGLSNRFKIVAIVMSSITIILLAGVSISMYKSAKKEDLKLRKKVSKRLAQKPSMFKKVEDAPKPKFTRSKNFYIPVVKASSAVVDDDLIELSKMENVTGLDFSNSKITGKNIDVLAGKPITYMNFADTKLQDSTFTHLAKFKKLVALRLEHVQLNDSCINSISKLDQLKVLDLEDTNLTNSQLKQIAKLENLVDLDVGRNKKLSEEGFLQLKKLKHLKIIYFTLVNITGDTLSKLLDELKELKEVWIISCKNLSQEDIDLLKKKYPKLNILGNPVGVDLESIVKFGDDNDK